MRNNRNLAAVSVLALALAACDGLEEEAEATAAVEAEEAVETGAEEAYAAEGEEAATEGEEAGEEEEAAEPAATPTPTPTPSATATVAAAPATPPASFTQCQVCHAVQAGQNGIGPSLAGVFGKKAGQVAGFSYTDGMRSANLTWDQATLDRYLANPQGVVPGTTMAVGPLNAAERTAIINYLKTL